MTTSQTLALRLPHEKNGQAITKGKEPRGVVIDGSKEKLFGGFLIGGIATL